VSVRVPGIAQNPEQRESFLVISLKQRNFPESSSRLLSVHWPELGHLYTPGLIIGKGIKPVDPMRPPYQRWELGSMVYFPQCSCLWEGEVDS
jgi:hypothetical protein